VVIPAYNEAGRLPVTLPHVLAYLEANLPDWELLVVDDGSADGTARVAQRLLDTPLARVIALPANRGKGAACRAGVLAAKGRRILLCDADLSTPIEEEARLRRAIDAGADVAIGSRAHPEARITESQGAVREAAGRGFNLVLRALRLTGFRDTQCGFKMFSHEAGQQLFSVAEIDGFLFDVEVLLLARGFGMRIVELPVEWRNDPDSRVHMLRDLPKIARDLARIRLRAGRAARRRKSPPSG
jgi:glycosyltransferase involved in cell wall biosynthesis